MSLAHNIDLILHWSPEDGVRKVGHPEKKWTDNIDQLAGAILQRSGRGEWRIAAEDRSRGKPWRRIGWPRWPKLRAAEERRGVKGACRTSEGLLAVGLAEPRGAPKQPRTYEDLILHITQTKPLTKAIQ